MTVSETMTGLDFSPMRLDGRGVSDERRLRSFGRDHEARPPTFLPQILPVDYLSTPSFGLPFEIRNSPNGDVVYNRIPDGATGRNLFFGKTLELQMPVGVTGRSQETLARLKGRIGCDADGCPPAPSTNVFPIDRRPHYLANLAYPPYLGPALEDLAASGKLATRVGRYKQETGL